LGTGGSRGAAGGSVGARRGTICGRLTEEEVDKACAECLGYRVGVRGVWRWDRGLVGLGLWCGGATAELRCFGLTWCRGQLDGIDFVALVEAETDDLPPVDRVIVELDRWLVWGRGAVAAVVAVGVVGSLRLGRIGEGHNDRLKNVPCVSLGFSVDRDSYLALLVLFLEVYLKCCGRSEYARGI
jgi:hypothetical protein